MTDRRTCLSPSLRRAATSSVIDWADWLGPEPRLHAAWLRHHCRNFAPRVAVQSPATSSRFTSSSEAATASTANVGYFTLPGPQPRDDHRVELRPRPDDRRSSTSSSRHRAPNQPGPDTIADAVDSRPTDAIWQNNLLTFVSTYPCTPTGDSTMRDCVRVSQLDTTGVSSVVSPTRRQDFLIAENGKDSYMGGVGMAGNGTLHVVWTRSSATAGDFPSSYAAYQLPSDARTRSARRSCSRQARASTPASAGATTSAWPRIRSSRPPCGRPTSIRRTGTEWKTWISRLQPPGTTYVPVTPVRVLDTRPGPGQIGLPGKFTAKVARTWQVTGVGGIPAGAVAVTGNVTVTQQEAAGFVAVTPTATNTPPSSTINFPLGDNRANNLTVPAVVDRHAVGHLRRHDRQEDPPHLRRDRLLPGRRHGRHVHPAGAGPRARHPARAGPDRAGRHVRQQRPADADRSPAPRRARRPRPRSPAT